MGAGKTLKSILISVGVRLSAFNLPQIARLTYTDDLHLEEMGEKKIALFCCIPDSDKSLNYLVGMIYGQLMLGYKKGDDGEPEIVPEEAEHIKMIFNLFLLGRSLRQIKEALERRNILTPRGNTEWGL